MDKLEKRVTELEGIVKDLTEASYDLAGGMTDLVMKLVDAGIVILPEEDE